MHSGEALKNKQKLTRRKRNGVTSEAEAKAEKKSPVE